MLVSARLTTSFDSQLGSPAAPLIFAPSRLVDATVRPTRCPRGHLAILLLNVQWHRVVAAAHRATSERMTGVEPVAFTLAR